MSQKVELVSRVQIPVQLHSNARNRKHESISSIPNGRQGSLVLIYQQFRKTILNPDSDGRRVSDSISTKMMRKKIIHSLMKPQHIHYVYS